jgi:hypothetical protein
VQASLAFFLNINRICKACLTMEAFLNFFHTFNLLVLMGVDAADTESEFLSRPSSYMGGKIGGALYLLCSWRGIRTKWQAKSTPAFPSSLGDPKIPNRLQFCVRQSAIAVWQFLANTVILLYLQNGVASKGTCERVSPAIVKFVGINHAVWPIAWFSFIRMLIDSTYRLVSVVFVATGISAPASWPPAFNSILDAWSLRRFWGLYWHQGLRWPFTAAATVFTRKILRMSKPDLLRRYTHTFCVFTLSGLLHLINDIFLGIPWQQSGSLLFFCSFTLGFIIEDSIEALWIRFKPKELRGTSIKLDYNGQAAIKAIAYSTQPWKKVLGAFWVCSWLSITTPLYLVPIIKGACQHGIGSDILHMAQRIDQGMGILALGMGALFLWLNYGIAL